MQKRERMVCLSVLLVSLASAVASGMVLQNGGAAWLLSFLRSTHVVWQKPAAFGWFHLAFLGACVLLSLFFGIYGYRREKTITDRAVFFAGMLLLLMEHYKQLYSYFVLWGGEYDFGIFPFQFCSLPLYLYLAVPLLPEGRFKEVLYQFLALFGTMGGCLVMAYPRFYPQLSICVHTMLWHTVMIAVGVLILFSRGYGKRWEREVLPASGVFLASLLLGTTLNVVLAPMAEISPNPLNLFYMSPYQSTYFLVVKDVWEACGWGAAMLCYILLFVFVGATLVFVLSWLIRYFVSLWRLRKRKDEKN